MKTYQKVLVSVATVILCLLLVAGGIVVYVGRLFMPQVQSAIERMEKMQAMDDATTIADALEAVSFSDWTQWSILLDTRAKVATYYFHAQFDTVFPIVL